MLKLFMFIMVLIILPPFIISSAALLLHGITKNANYKLNPKFGYTCIFFSIFLLAFFFGKFIIAML